MTPMRRPTPRARRAAMAPSHVPMAPTAGLALDETARRQRRSWWPAAAATGILLAPAHVAMASTSLAEELPIDLIAAALEAPSDTAGIGPWDGVIDAWTTPAATVPALAGGPGAPVAQSATSPAPSGDAEAQVGALPDGSHEIARYGDVVLVAEGESLELVGFHESADPAALELSPTETPPEARAGEDRGPVVVLPTRNRGTSATSSVDLAIRTGEPVPAPVTGEVIQVVDFALYGASTDTLIEIRPDDDPTVIVKVLHVEDPSVAVGDRVEAGDTEIAANARELPFDSQIDAYTTTHRGAPAPHVHIELRRDAAHV